MHDETIYGYTNKHAINQINILNIMKFRGN